MTIAEMILPEFDREMATTRSLLERVPAADADWKPHEKSATLGFLAFHIARLVSWGAIAVQTTRFDASVSRAGGFETVEKLLAYFDANVAETRAAIAGTSDADMSVPWSLLNGTATIFTMPRVVVLRSFLMNHLIHHRGQLSVYLRLRDVPLPSIYGPTADT